MKGFSLIELIVVFTIVALMLAFVIPGFNNFNRGQILKAAAEDLVASLREAQSSALSGKKASSCTENDTLIGYYITFSKDMTGYSIGLRCGINNPVDSPHIKDVLFSSSGVVKVKEILPVPSSGAITIMFQPVNKGVKFINGDSAGLNMLDTDSLAVDLTNGLETYGVTISSAGDIYEKKIQL